MASKKKAENKITVKVERGAEREDPNLFVAINGVSYLVPKGKTSELPDYVAEEIKRAEAAKENFYQSQSRMCGASI